MFRIKHITKLHYALILALLSASNNLRASNLGEAPNEILAAIFLSGVFKNYFELHSLSLVNKRLNSFVVEDWANHASYSLVTDSNDIAKLMTDFPFATSLPSKKIKHVFVEGATILVSHDLGLSLSRDRGQHFTTILPDERVTFSQILGGRLFAESEPFLLLPNEKETLHAGPSIKGARFLTRGAKKGRLYFLVSSSLLASDDDGRTNVCIAEHLRLHSIVASHDGKNIYLGSEDNRLYKLTDDMPLDGELKKYLEIIDIDGPQINLIAAQENIVLLTTGQSNQKNELLEINLDDKQILRKIKLPKSTRQVMVSDKKILVVANNKFLTCNADNNSFDVIADGIKMIVAPHATHAPVDEDRLIAVTSHGLEFRHPTTLAVEKTIMALGGDQINATHAVKDALVMLSGEDLLIADAHGHGLRKADCSITKHQPQRADFAVSPDASIILVSNPDKKSAGQMHFSVDGGRSFTSVETKTFHPRAVVFMNDGQIWLVASDKGLRRCDDKTGNFCGTNLNEPITSLSVSADEKTIVAGGGRSATLYISHDGGASFTSKLLDDRGSCDIIRFALSRDGTHIYVAIVSRYGGTNLYYSHDSGQTFSSDIDDKYCLEDIALDEATNTLFFASGDSLFSLALETIQQDSKLSLRLHNVRPRKIAISPQGYLFIGSSTGQCYRKNLRVPHAWQTKNSDGESSH